MNDCSESSCPYSMTNEIAFELGLGKYSSFYDMAVWEPNNEQFKYVHFFKWGNPQRACRDKESNWVWVFYGGLNESKFENLDQKVNFIKGLFHSYAGKISEKEAYLCFANSFKLRDLAKEWISEVLKDKFGGDEIWSVEVENRIDLIPGIAKLKVEGSNKLISFLTSKQ